MFIPFKRLALCSTAIICSIVPSMADVVADFDPDQLYTIKNKATGTSMIIGVPEPEMDYPPVELGSGLGGAKLRKGDSGGWQILSPCEGVIGCTSDYALAVMEESNFGIYLSPENDYFRMTCKIDGVSYYIVSDDGWIAMKDNPIGDASLWEILPLPDGAIIDVPTRVEMANRTFASEYVGNPPCAWRIDLSDEMGFACAHEVVAETLTLIRELKAGWQGICAPIALDSEDWNEFGKLYRLDKLEEAIGSDGTPEISLCLAEADTFEPNKPYLIYVENPSTISIEKTEWTVSPSDGMQVDVVETASTRCELACVYDYTTVPHSEADSPTKIYALANGSFKRPGANGATLKPYRVILTVTTTSQHPARIAVNIGEEPAGIQDIDADATQQWYDLNGRPATPNARGLLISPSGKAIIH